MQHGRYSTEDAARKMQHSRMKHVWNSARMDAEQKNDMRERTGLVQIYSGDGKGKTTAGMGQCVRAAGYGYKVLIFQFLKDNSGNERKAMERIPGIVFEEGPQTVKFSFRMSPEEKQEQKRWYEEKLKMVFQRAAEERFDLLFLDEALYAVRGGLLDEDLLVRLIKERPENLEILLTGQDPGERLTALCDYHSEIQKRKHPYDAGQTARDGIER